MSWFEKWCDIAIKFSFVSSCCNVNEIKDEVLPEKYKVY